MTAEPLRRNQTNQVSMNMTSFQDIICQLPFVADMFTLATDGSVRQLIARKTSLFFVQKKKKKTTT